MTATSSPVEVILDRLDNVRRSGTGWTAACPSHDDHDNSLSIGVGDDGRALVHCFAGCSLDAILDALHMRPVDLFAPGSMQAPPLIGRNGHARPPAKPHDQPATRRLLNTTRYEIRDATGTIVAAHLRRDYDDRSKDMPWVLPDGTAGLGGMPYTELPLYGVHELADAMEVVVCEGEKVRDALDAAGIVAVGTVTGAKACPSDARLRPIVGRTVIFWPDNDDAGREHMEMIARRLLALGHPVDGIRRVAWPDAPPKGDAADCSAERARRLVFDAPLWVLPDSSSTIADPSSAPRFPIEVLPPKVRAYVEAAAESIPVPVEMVAVPLLGVTGALLGNRLSLALKSSYREYASLYLAIIAPPGAAKSPALKLAMWALDVLQRRAMERYRDELAAYEVDMERWKTRKVEERGDKPAKPVLRHYFSSNLTLEALVGMMEHSPGVAIIRDEILSWVRSMDQYRGGKGSDRQEFLSLWASQTIKADRKGGEPIYRPYPVAAVIGGVQPDYVGELHDEAQRRDGFVERLLPIVLDVGAARWTEVTIDQERFTDLLTVFEKLDRLPLADVDGDPMKSVGIAVELTTDAKDLWVAWFNENAAVTEHAPGLAGGFYRKLPAHVARLALILHALWTPDDPRPMVSVDQMSDAIELGEFFREHIGRLLPLLRTATPTQTAGLSSRILRILRIFPGDEADGWVARSDIINGLRTVKADEMTAALAALHSAGVVERRTTATATKPIEQWRLSSNDDSEYSEDSPQDERNSEYSEYPNEKGPALAETVANLLTLPPIELDQYREELADALPDDPYLAHDRAAAAAADRMRAEVSSCPPP